MDLNLIILIVLLPAWVYLIGSAVAVSRFVGRPLPGPSDPAAVSVLKPLHGDEPGLYANLRSFAEQQPNVRVITEHYGFDDPTGGLRDGATDVAIVRPPFTSDGLELLVVATEPRFAALPAGHPLARGPAIDFHELEDEPWIEVDSDPVWCDFWRANERRTKPPVFGARGRALDDLLEAARDGRATGLVPASIAHSQNWPDLAFVKVTDVPESKVAIAWRTTHQPAPVRDFVTLAGELAEPDAIGDPAAT